MKGHAHLTRLARALLIAAGVALLCPSAPTAGADPTTEATSTADSCSPPLHSRPRQWETSELKSLYRGMVLLQSGEAPDFLAGRVISDLQEYGGLKDSDELSDPKTQTAIFSKLTQQLRKLGHLHEVAGSLLAPARVSVQRVPIQPDILDMVRGWGWRYLRDDDPTFNEPEYLANIMAESGATGAGMVSSGTAGSNALTAFEEEWAQLVPPNVSKPCAFALTGTQANNLLFEVATEVARRRLYSIDSTRYRLTPDFQGNILVFKGTYRGANGRIKNVPAELELPDATVASWGASDRGIQSTEDEVIRLVEEKAADPRMAIGGVFLEVITSEGVRSYRPGFLRRLRATCDRLGLAIFDDEIMSGGGRTGKFFAYQHYEGFEPDFVTFGKGMIVAGVANVDRSTPIRYARPSTFASTLINHNELLWKSAQILKRIRTGNLIQNAAEVGQYLIARLNELYPYRTSGMGLMIHGNSPAYSILHNRLLPYLSLSRAEVDAALGPPGTQPPAAKTTSLRHF